MKTIQDLNTVDDVRALTNNEMRTIVRTMYRSTLTFNTIEVNKEFTQQLSFREILNCK